MIVSRIVFAALLCGACLMPKALAGVTLLTHGFNANASDWVTSMGNAVSRYAESGVTNFTIYKIFFEQNAQGQYEPRQQKLQGGDPLNADSGEIIILLDWSQLAGTLFPNPQVLYSTTNVAPSIASALTAPDFITDLAGRALVELPLHFIGHSRGGSLIYEISKLLGQQGIWVDHITTLDPHPLNNDFDDSFVTSVVDAPAVPYVNVLFADNYYQVNASFLGSDPSGQYVRGAYNRLLDVRVGGYSGFAINHSNVHLWYHGTIDWLTPASDGVASITAMERNAWWTAPETNGANAGFRYSLRGEGNRFSTEAPAGGTNKIVDGFNKTWDLGAGIAANRSPLPENSGAWPNLLTLSVTSTNLVSSENGRRVLSLNAGEELPLTFRYQYGQLQDTNLQLEVFLDTDFNPYSSNQIVLQALALTSTGKEVVGTLMKHIPGSRSIPEGLYSVGATISNGVRKRHLYAREIVEIRPAPLSLQFASVSVKSGTVEVLVQSASGNTIVVEASSDFETWSPILTNTLSLGTWTFTEPLVQGVDLQFFRAKRID